MTGMVAVRLLVTILALCSGLAPEWVQADATFTRPDGVVLEAAQTEAGAPTVAPCDSSWPSAPSTMTAGFKLTFPPLFAS